MRERALYPWATTLQTRWSDNDSYGHINNATYLSLLDTALSEWQHGVGLLNGNARFLIVATTCNYHAELAYPDVLTCGLVCDHIGRTSFRLSLALFKGEAPLAATTGTMTQVAVDPESHIKRSLTDAERDLLSAVHIDRQRK